LRRELAALRKAHGEFDSVFNVDAIDARLKAATSPHEKAQQAARWRTGIAVSAIDTVGEELGFRQLAEQQRLRIVVALAMYRADHQQYPDSLAALTPRYLDEIPADDYTEQPFCYRREGEGYALWSVGRNGQDDGGRDSNSEEIGDDLVIRHSL
jgi:hypothetical protein